jgi:membrane fusion protein, multidrug efflux system
MKHATVFAWLGLAFLSACNKPPAPAAEVRPVRTVVASQISGGEDVSLTGHIRARTEESLAFRVDGRMLVRHVNVGQEVKPNDLIAELDPQLQRDALRTAQARVTAAAAALTEASNNLDRQRALVGQGWSTRVQYDAAERTYLSAKAEVDAAAAQLHSAEEQLGYTQLRADAAGVVVAKGAEPGEIVQAGKTIVTIAEHDGADAVFDVPASLLHQVSPDDTISIALSDDPTVQTTGRVRELAPQADPVTQTFRAKIALTEWPEAMRLGSTVIGHAHLLARGGIELPATALTMADNKPAVWVVNPKTQEVSLRQVELQQEGSSTIVISRGLAGGEVVVTAGVHALRPGQKVRLQEASS